MGHSMRHKTLRFQVGVIWRAPTTYYFIFFSEYYSLSFHYSEYYFTISYIQSHRDFNDAQERPARLAAFENSLSNAHWTDPALDVY